MERVVWIQGRVDYRGRVEYRERMEYRGGEASLSYTTILLNYYNKILRYYNPTPHLPI